MQTAYIGTLFDDFVIKNESDNAIRPFAVLYNKPNGCKIEQTQEVASVAKGGTFQPVFNMKDAKVGRYNLEIYSVDDQNKIQYLLNLSKDAVEAVTVSQSAQTSNT